MLILARSGPRPLVRLQLLPDLGGKALDLLVSPERLTGWFPATGEGVDWALPDDACAHPLLFIGITLLERFTPVTEDRVLGASGGQFELAPVVEGSRVRFTAAEWRIGWGPWVRWIVRKDEVLAPEFHLKLRDLRIAPLGSLDENLLRIERR